MSVPWEADSSPTVQPLDPHPGHPPVISSLWPSSLMSTTCMSRLSYSLGSVIVNGEPRCPAPSPYQTCTVTGSLVSLDSGNIHCPRRQNLPEGAESADDLRAGAYFRGKRSVAIADPDLQGVAAQGCVSNNLTRFHCSNKCKARQVPRNDQCAVFGVQRVLRPVPAKGKRSTKAL
jgi:hypothetical protein